MARLGRSFPVHSHSGRPPALWAVSAPTTYRRNLCTNPSFEVDVSGIFDFGASFSDTIVRTAGGAVAGSSWCARQTLSAADAGSISGTDTALPSFAAGANTSLPSGGSLALSLYVRSSAAIPAGNAQLEMSWGDAANTANFISAPAIPANTWTRVSGVLTIPNMVGASTNQFTYFMITPSPAAGVTIDFDAILYEVSSTVGTYFDGSFAGGTWEGDPGDSASYVGTQPFTTYPATVTLSGAGGLTAGATSTSGTGVRWKATLDGTYTDNVSAGFENDSWNRQTAAGDDAASGIAWPISLVSAPGGRPDQAVPYTLPALGKRYESVAATPYFNDGDGPFYFGDAFYLDSAFPVSGGGGYQVISQLRQADDTGSPGMAVEVTGGSLKVTGGYGILGASPADQYAYSVTLMSVAVSTWYNVVWSMNFSATAGGSVLNVWVNGTQVLTSYTVPPPTVIGTGGTYWKTGLYHDPTSAPISTLYHAGTAVGGSYAAVDPTASLTYTTNATLSGSGGLTAGAIDVAQGAVTLGGRGSLSATAFDQAFDSVALAGAGSLSAVDVATGQAAVSLAGAGSLAASDVATGQAAVSFAGRGGLSTAATATGQAAAILAGAVSLSAAPTATGQGAVALAGAGALTVSAIDVGLTSAAFAGAGALTATGFGQTFNSAAFAGASSLTASGFGQTFSSVGLAGAGALAVSAIDVGLTSVALAGSGGLAVSSFATGVSNATFAGAGSLSAVDTATEVASVALQGAGSFTVTAIGGVASVILSGVGGLDPAAYVQAPGSVALAGGGDLTVTALDVAQAVLTLAGSGSLTAVALDAGLASVALAGDSALTATGSGGSLLSVALDGSGTLTAAVTATGVAAVSLAGDGELSAGGLRIVGAAVSLAGDGTVTASVGAVSLASVQLAGTGSLSAGGTSLTPVSGSATLAGAASLVVGAVVSQLAAASLDGSGSLSVEASVTAYAAALLSGAGALTGTAGGTVAGGASLSGSGTLAAAAFRAMTTAALLSGSGGLSAAAIHHVGPLDWLTAGDPSYGPGLVAQAVAVADLVVTAFGVGSGLTAARNGPDGLVATRTSSGLQASR